MCGICGIYEYARQRPVNGRLIARMVESVRHRGPDDEGYYTDQDVGLGMSRLSIIDMKTGRQPMFNEDKTVVVVLNGEIYNYVELKQNLLERGHAYLSSSDTEVLPHLYEEKGAECVEELRGMFAFALWDRTNRRLLIARDRLGIKPLYYTVIHNKLIFSSEIKAILQVPGVPVSLDKEGLSCFISLKYVAAPLTLFKGIYSLPPGHLLLCDRSGVKIQRYWDPSFIEHQTLYRNEEEVGERFMELLRESVRLRLRCDVPFGAFLSGGVDSSGIVALMDEMLNEPVKTFSVGFESEKTQDERVYARLAAERFRTEHFEVVLRWQDFLQYSEKVIWHLDQPIADQATVATYMLSELAAKHVKMVLTGEGGDELFAGYARYAGEKLSPLFGHLPQSMRSLAVGVGDALPGFLRGKIALFALCQKEEATRFSSWFPLFNCRIKKDLLSQDFQDEVSPSIVEEIYEEHLCRTDARTPLSRMLYVDMKLWLPDFLLLRGDKMSMAASLEARVPFLDHKLVEFVNGLPDRHKLNGFKRKYLLKKCIEKMLPKEIVNRKKQGFPIPISEWFRKEARPFVYDTLFSKSLEERGLFKMNYIKKMLREHESGLFDHGNLIWGIMNIEMWHRIFVDEPMPERAFMHGGARGDVG